MTQESNEIKFESAPTITGLCVLDIFYRGRLLDTPKAKKMPPKKLQFKGFFKLKRVR